MGSGSILVVSAPSGAGKTSLVKKIISDVPDMAVAVSHTTRPMREGDVDGRDYHFVDRPTFESMIAENAFVEHADVFGNFYGTSHEAISACHKEGSDVILEIDWQGAGQVKKKEPDATAIFIIPPSRDVLLARLRGRGTDSEEVIARRTAEAVEEMRHLHDADYLVINDEFDEAFLALESIIKATRLRTAVQVQRHRDMIDGLVA